MVLTERQGSSLLRETDGTAECGTNIALWRWHRNLWHQDCNIHMAQQCKAPKVHRGVGRESYGTKSATYICTTVHGTNSAP